MRYNSPNDLNCGIFSHPDKPIKTEVELNYKLQKFKNLCIRRKAMYNLEYASLIINAVLSFLCANFSLINCLKEGKGYQTITGLFGFISGIIGFILTIIYVCFSGYIFTNDLAYGTININFNNFLTRGPYLSGRIIKLFPNGAKYKFNGNKYITPYEVNSEYYGQYIKYKDLGDKQYNFDKDLYIKYYENLPQNSNTVNGCNILDSYNPENLNAKINNCDYLFSRPYYENTNRYLYNMWLTSLVLSVFIFILDLVLAVFGFLVFLDKQSAIIGNDLIDVK